MIGPITSTITKEDIFKYTTEIEILSYYLDINKIPCVIQSPLRVDNNPSFSIFTRDGSTLFYKDFSTGESGNLFTLFKKLWCCTYKQVLERLYADMSKFNKDILITKSKCKDKGTKPIFTKVSIDIVPRQWKDYDIAYWKEYGISLESLIKANVTPVSHKIVIKEDKETLYVADKYAYAFIENKENKRTCKIYQPYSKRFKWNSTHDKSVISLWTLLPQKGGKVILTSSLKDALCLIDNTGIPSIALQGEGYMVSNTVIKELQKRFTKVYILFDNDAPGIKCGKNLSEATGFEYVELPKINNAKDPSDLYKSLSNKDQFKEIITQLID